MTALIPLRPGGLDMPIIIPAEPTHGEEEEGEAETKLVEDLINKKDVFGHVGVLDNEEDVVRPKPKPSKCLLTPDYLLYPDSGLVKGSFELTDNYHHHNMSDCFTGESHRTRTVLWMPPTPTSRNENENQNSAHNQLFNGNMMQISLYLTTFGHPIAVSVSGPNCGKQYLCKVAPAGHYDQPFSLLVPASTQHFLVHLSILDSTTTIDSKLLGPNSMNFILSDSITGQSHHKPGDGNTIDVSGLSSFATGQQSGPRVSSLQGGNKGTTDDEPTTNSETAQKTQNNNSTTSTTVDSDATLVEEETWKPARPREGGTAPPLPIELLVFGVCAFAAVALVVIGIVWKVTSSRRATQKATRSAMYQPSANLMGPMPPPCARLTHPDGVKCTPPDLNL
eukprot:TRINITY_DN63329_c0_g2_i4.p1 TRINITY_DN63329_c0_g2~~TRINITY_DN63329_c0_g2_i4.p1  ORF type:complete len:427 (+),score=48.56 TRINITY_DN63329_c0_g2_i4:103-1281(+)